MLGFRFGFVLCCSGILFVACGESDKEDAAWNAKRTEGVTFLDVHFVLGSTLEELTERFGEPDAYRPQLGNQPYGNVKWNDLKGVKVFAVIKDSLCAYVNYGFYQLDPFAETEAFRIIGVERPEEDPTVSVPKTGVTKWYPFEHYHHLTVSSQAKNVSVKGYDFVIVPGTS